MQEHLPHQASQRGSKDSWTSANTNFEITLEVVARS
jgi:hypothetical protein